MNSFFLQRWLSSLLRRTANFISDPDAEKLARLSRLATLDPTAKLYPTCNISNRSNDPSKIVIGANSHVQGDLLLFRRSGKITIGEWCYIAESCRIWSRTSVEIGNYVGLGHLVDVFDTNCHPMDIADHRRDFESILGKGHDDPELFVEDKPVVIEDDVRIGCKSTILKGVRIGRGSFIAANAVVTHDVPPMSIVAGNPAKVIKKMPNWEKYVTPEMAAAKA